MIGCTCFSIRTSRFTTRRHSSAIPQNRQLQMSTQFASCLFQWNVMQCSSLPCRLDGTSGPFCNGPRHCDHFSNFCICCLWFRTQHCQYVFHPYGMAAPAFTSRKPSIISNQQCGNVAQFNSRYFWKYMRGKPSGFCGVLFDLSQRNER